MLDGAHQPRFAGKTVLVTGASTGIGRAVAEQLGRDGAQVILTARREAEGRAAAAQVGGGAVFMRCDLADPASIDALFANIETRFGGLDGAVNNAGRTQDAVPLHRTPVEEYDAVMNVNIRGLWLSLRHEMRLLEQRGGGAIVNVASIAGLRGFPGLSLYVASKHAVIGMTKSAALDVAALGIRVNCLCPGTTRTEMMEMQMETRPGGEAKTVAGIPLGRASDPAEQAAAAIWLLGSEASFVTGQCLVVDGGRTIA